MNYKIGFYRGLDILIVLTIPKTAVRFSSNEFLKNNVFTVSISL